MSPTIKVGERNADVNDQKESKQSSEEKKEIVRNQIQTLRRLKSEIKQKLNSSSFQVENISYDTRHFCQTNDLLKVQAKKLPIADFVIKTELFNFAGVRCIKCLKNEYIFNFFAKGEENKTCVYSVQFFNVDNKGELGKYVMPKFIDIESILKETPLENIMYAVHFVRNCKHYIDCYHNRMDQFVTLKKSLGKVTNCNLDANLGYKCINIELLGVYDVEAEEHISIQVYLLYDIKETRPQLIKVDTLRGAPLHEETEKGLKSYLKAFKKLTLIEAFESIQNEENSLFSWRKTEKDQSLLNLQDSDESSFEEFIPQRKRRRRNSFRRSGVESFTENDLTLKNKRKREIKRKIPVSSEKITVEHVENKNRPRKLKLKTSHPADKKNLWVKTDAIQKRKGRKNPKPSKIDISKFLMKYKNLSESKDSNESEKKGSEKEKSSKEFRISEKRTTRATREATKLNRVELTPHKNIEIIERVNQKNAQRKVLMKEKIIEHETSGEGRVLRSATNSPAKADFLKKIDSPKKSTPQKVVSQKETVISMNIPRTSPRKKVIRKKRLVTPKKIAPSKKVAALKKPAVSKITISPNASKTKLKQTNLKFQVPIQELPGPSHNSSSTETTETIKLDYKSKFLRSNVVTSTPKQLFRKDLKGPLETDLNISEIQYNVNPQIAKLQAQSSVVLERVEKTNLARKAAAKSGIKKPSEVKR